MKTSFTVSAAIIALASSAFAHDHSDDHKDDSTPPPPAAPTRTDIGDGLYMIEGQGGNILFSTGPDGTFVVDDQMQGIAAQNIALIEEVSETPIVFVLNTHYHFDHVGGNEEFVKAGATILSHDNVRTRLLAAEGETKVDESALPVITFSKRTTLHWNGKEIHIKHLPAAHTDGDSIVHFHHTNVVHTGDIMFSGLYPYIDLDGGGTVDGYIDAMTYVYDMADENTKIVPGHGPLSAKADVQASIDMLRQGRDLVRAEMMKGLDRDAVIAANPLAIFNDTYSWGFISGDRMTGTFFDDLMATDEDAKKAVEAGPVAETAPETAEPEAPVEAPAEPEAAEAADTPETDTPEPAETPASDAPEAPAEEAAQEGN